MYFSHNHDSHNTLQLAAHFAFSLSFAFLFFLFLSRQVFMNYGSYWQGIFVVQLKAQDGSPIVGTLASTPVNIAKDPNVGEVIEASWIEPDPNNNSALWLFVNYGQCCDGIKSTYRIALGVSTAGPEGPFLDKDGIDMVQGGGTIVFDKVGRQIGVRLSFDLLWSLFSFLGISDLLLHSFLFDPCIY